MHGFSLSPVSPTGQLGQASSLNTAHGKDAVSQLGSVSEGSWMICGLWMPSLSGILLLLMFIVNGLACPGYLWIAERVKASKSVTF